uniref:Uncharacterized protein n=1 Tax=Lactuca sativa TaxID=4236 RepID=A0A9R1XBS8_LACSA|nr:hypothetical protein LSAT_V11C500247590 [Lactuca sativa]
MIREGKVKKNKQGKNFKGKPQDDKGKRKKSPQNPPPKKKENVAKDDICFQCGVIVQWERNFLRYLVELKNKKVGEGTSGISTFIIKMGLFTFLSNTRVFDIGCGTNICNSLHGFRKSRKMKKNEMVLHVGNGARVVVQATRHFDLCLPFGLYLTLNNVC